MNYRHIRLEEAGGVATLTFDRPDVLNALSAQTLAETIDAVDRVRDDGRARVLLLTGAGRAFSTGADLVDAAAGLASGAGSIDAGRALETHFNPLLERLMALPVPLVTAVNGAAAGAGCSFALAGDIVVAARSAYFLQAFVNVGLVPDVGATWLLPRLAGRARAQAMMMLGERISAEQAERWGLIWKVVDDAALADEAAALATRLAAGPTRAFGLIRQGLRECLDKPLSDALEVERRNQRAAGQTADFAEGVAAFLQKRPPRFSGK